MPMPCPSVRRCAPVTRWLGCMIVCAMPAAVSLRGADGPASGLAQREVSKRTETLREAQALMTEADLFSSKGDFEEAAKLHRQAWEMLPDAPMSAAQKRRARDGFSAAAVAHAKKLAAAGRYPEARALLQAVLAENFNPGNEAAKTFREQLDDPDRFEPALTPEHLGNVAAVQKELRMGDGLLTLGNYNEAIARFSNALRVDPYNSAARRGMERAEQFKSEYYDAARDQNRARRLSEVDRGWEDPVPATDLSSLFGGGSAGLGAMGGSKENILVKLRSLLIPIVDLQGASLQEVVEFLRIRSRDLDPTKKGVDFVLKVSPETAAMPVTLNMVSVPIEEVLRYATEMSGTVYRADEFAVTITSRAEKSTTLVAKSYRVPPDFLQNAPADGAGAAPAPADPFAPAQAQGGGLQIRRLGAREFLEQRGVVFPEGTAATYNPGTNILFVKNTAENLAMIDALVEQALSSAPKQVEVHVRMVEINERRLQELGFDWLMGQFNVPGSSSIFGSGGTVGNQGAPANSDFPMTFPGSGGVPVGVNPITAGLRSSGNILGVPSIDGLIGGIAVPTINSRSPGVFALTGVFTDPQFQVVIRALSQCKGVDVVSTPSVVTKSGQRANISIVRELIYPTEFDPPQIPQNVDGSGTAPVTPATPTAFEKRDVGVTLEVEPVVGDNNRTVDLNLVPSSVEFEGFINYGSPISTATVDALGNATLTQLTENRIIQPVFRTNKVTTSVTVWDGNTVVLGGVMYERRQDIQDKVPVLGDIPIIGRSFRSQVSQTERKNVIFFVTARVIDPAGHRVNPAAAGQPIVAAP